MKYSMNSENVLMNVFLHVYYTDRQYGMLIMEDL
jgi:hypothetical protein